MTRGMYVHVCTSMHMLVLGEQTYCGFHPTLKWHQPDVGYRAKATIGEEFAIIGPGAIVTLHGYT